MLFEFGLDDPAPPVLFARLADSEVAVTCRPKGFVMFLYNNEEGNPLTEVVLGAHDELPATIMTRVAESLDWFSGMQTDAGWRSKRELHRALAESIRREMALAADDAPPRTAIEIYRYYKEHRHEDPYLAPHFRELATSFANYGFPEAEFSCYLLAAMCYQEGCKSLGWPRSAAVWGSNTYLRAKDLSIELGKGLEDDIQERVVAMREYTGSAD